MRFDNHGMAPFIPLGSYEWPATPTEHVLRRWWLQAKRQLRRDDDGPVRAEDRLERATLKTLDDVAAPPACGPLLEELGASLEDWLADAAPESWLAVVVMPPCDRNDIVRTWAETNGHRIVAPPPRHQLIGGELAAQAALDDLEGDGLIVLPRLEEWFLRHRNGLASVRALLSRLTRLERHCLIGCNSFAWAFLAKAVGAAVLLPKPSTFTAFDAGRLHDWFSALSDDDATRQITFRSAQNGEDVLARDETFKDEKAKDEKAKDAKDSEEKASDQNGCSDSAYLKRLAARSLGVPWVAWHLWRQSMRSSADAAEVSSKAQKATANDERTLWLAPIEEMALPLDHEESALLALQALLIHDALTPAELDSVLPSGGGPDIIAALIRGGFVDREGDRLRVRPAAYPAIREALKADGFPVDVL